MWDIGLHLTRKLSTVLCFGLVHGETLAAQSVLQRIAVSKTDGSNPGGVGDFPALHSVQTGSGAQPTSYVLATGRSFFGGNESGA
jgi:hypothetical protein